MRNSQEVSELESAVRAYLDRTDEYNERTARNPLPTFDEAAALANRCTEALAVVRSLVSDG